MNDLPRRRNEQHILVEMHVTQNLEINVSRLGVLHEQKDE
jgi:hypothetical protein